MNPNKTTKRIALCVCGGDAPGINAATYAIAISAFKRNWEVYGIRDGFRGVLEPGNYRKGVIKITEDLVRGINATGGTILGSSRVNPLKFPLIDPAGVAQDCDCSDDVIKNLRSKRIDTLIIIGGDLSLEIAHQLSLKGLKVVVIPKTIDNNLERTETTSGFDTAVTFAAKALDQLRTTNTMSKSIVVIDVMGKDAGWIALDTGMSGEADVILVPEIPYNLEKVAQKIMLQNEKKGNVIVVVSEGARPVRTDSIPSPDAAGSVSVGQRVAAELGVKTGMETQLVNLGHLLRGGMPTAFDRILALRLGAAAVRALEQGESGVLVVLEKSLIKSVPIKESVGKTKSIPLSNDKLLAARDLGIAFGD